MELEDEDRAKIQQFASVREKFGDGEENMGNDMSDKKNWMS